jgi:hypothetical protein
MSEFDRETERFIREQCAMFQQPLPEELKNKPWITDQEFDRERKALQVERVEFVREAAIRIYAGGNTHMDYKTAWYRANRLWESKPEDC